MKYVNTGYSPNFLILDINLKDYIAVIEPDTAFWAIVESAYLPEALKSLVEKFESKKKNFKKRCII